MGIDAVGLLGSVFPFEPIQLVAAFLAEYTLRGLLWLAMVSPEFAVAAAPVPLLVLAMMAALLLLLPKGMGLKPWACLVLLGFVFYRPAKLEEGGGKSYGDGCRTRFVGVDTNA